VGGRAGATQPCSIEGRQATGPLRRLLDSKAYRPKAETERRPVNYPAMRWVASEDCTVKGPGRAILWVIAYHADRDTGECWVGQRRLARESGLARATVQRALDKLFADGLLEPIEDHQGPKPERYMIAPHLVEGESFGSGVVEGTSTASKVVEHEAIVGEVIHNPGSSSRVAGGDLTLRLSQIPA
jgi:hypothetical protein